LDGKSAVAYLSKAGPYQGREDPCLILLDLSMPGTPGLDILKWLRNEPALAHLPVVVLTSSNQERDIHRAYLLGADGYIIKPGNPQELLRIVKALRIIGWRKNVHRENLSISRPHPMCRRPLNPRRKPEKLCLRIIERNAFYLAASDLITSRVPSISSGLLYK